MSGVHRRFAVSKGTVQLPEKFQHEITPGWNLFAVNTELAVACYQKDDLAMVLVLTDKEDSLNEMLHMLEDANPHPEYTNTFDWPPALAPAGVRTIEFNIAADSSSRVITSVNQTNRGQTWLPSPSE